MSTLRRCLLPALGLVALLSPSAGASTTPHICYSLPREIQAKAPAGASITTSATLNSSAGCAPAYQGGVRGFIMTVSWTGTVSGKGPFVYEFDCGGYSQRSGPFTQNCGDTYTWFCAAPGTSPCTANLDYFVWITNTTLTLDHAEADSALRSISCAYAV